MLRTGTYLQDRYEIIELIGSGGMSVVYKARCHKLNRYVAIKVLKEEFSSDAGFVAKFKMEAQTASGLAHPNIVNVYDVVDDGILHYIVMELIEGITLKTYIQKKGRLDSREAAGIALQVAQGIAAAHERKIIHRDIKPQNMIISREGKVKVADFGIARAASSETMTVNAMGSVHYISPEQARGGYCDARSDIYSFGITMYEMVTGRVPFEGENTVTVALAHLQEPITRPSHYNEELPVSLENIILKCTEKKPEHRYSSITEVIADLRHVLVRPEDDFVAMPVERDFGGETVMISARELEEIKKGRSTGPVVPVHESSVQKTSAQKNRTQKAAVHKRGAHYDDYYDDEQEESVNPKIEKLMAAVGVVMAILILALLVVVFSKVGGIFRFGGDSTPTKIQTETVDVRETLSDTQVYMPSAIDLPVDMAEAKLKENTLVMRVAGYEDSDTVPKGYVISQLTPEGTAVDKYSTVDVIVSNGSDLVDLSQLGLLGMDGEAARLLLKQCKLDVTVQPEYSDMVVEGKLIRYEPQSAREGERVTIFVSAGSIANMRTVPEITNLTEDEAIGRIVDAELVPGEMTEAFSDTVPRGSIISQGAEANTMIKVGTAVSYVISKGPEGKRFVGAISETYHLNHLIGPGATTSSLVVEIRLRQDVDGQPVYKTLMQPKTLTGTDLLPVDFPSIEGVSGIEYGEVEIVNTDTGVVIQSYPVRFFETE